MPKKRGDSSDDESSKPKKGEDKKAKTKAKDAKEKEKEKKEEVKKPTKGRRRGDSSEDESPKAVSPKEDTKKGKGKKDDVPEAKKEDSDEEPESPKEKTFYNSDDDKVGNKDDEDLSKLTRKERKAIQKEREQARKEAAIEAQRAMDSPFSISVPADAYNVAANERNISLPGISVSVHGAELFKNTDLKISQGRRYGLIGPNGRGKSTLLHLLASREFPVPANLNIQLVQQEQEVEGGESTCVEVVISSDQTRLELLAEAERLRASDEDADQAKLRAVEEELIATDAYAAEAKARKILHGLGFPPEWQDRKTKSFSGGWRKRIALACAVFIEPDVLLLDEPTNHLDLNAVIWLETYLPAMYNSDKVKQKALVIVSHDLDFLDEVCTDIVHIDKLKLNYYRGNYQKFVQGREEIQNEKDRSFHKQQQQIKNWKKSGWTKKQIEEEMKKRAQREGKMLDEYLLEKRRDYRVNFPFPEPAELREAYISKLENVEFHYPGGESLFKDLNLAIWTDSRITLVGPNGIGKSTLLNLLCGVLKPTSGTASYNHLVRVGRYSQHFVDSVPLDKTPVDYLCTQSTTMDAFKARALLGSFGLESHRHLEKIGVLSGGQKARVAFAGISVKAPHVLLFDEPTNHLDMESIQALATSINSFKGGVVLVSHDARLIQETVKELWVVGNKTVDSRTYSTFESYKEHVLEELGLEEYRKEEEKAEKEKQKAERLRKREEEKKKAQKKAQKGKNKKKNDSDDDDDSDESSEEEEEDGEEIVEETKKPAPAKASEPPKPKAKAQNDKLANFFSKKDTTKKK